MSKDKFIDAAETFDPIAIANCAIGGASLIVNDQNILDDRLNEQANKICHGALMILDVPEDKLRDPGAILAEDPVTGLTLTDKIPQVVRDTFQGADKFIEAIKELGFNPDAHADLARFRKMENPPSDKRRQALQESEKILNLSPEDRSTLIELAKKHIPYQEVPETTSEPNATKAPEGYPPP